MPQRSFRKGISDGSGRLWSKSSLTSEIGDLPETSLRSTSHRINNIPVDKSLGGIAHQMQTQISFIGLKNQIRFSASEALLILALHRPEAGQSLGLIFKARDNI